MYSGAKKAFGLFYINARLDFKAKYYSVVAMCSLKTTHRYSSSLFVLGKLRTLKMLNVTNSALRLSNRCINQTCLVILVTVAENGEAAPLKSKGKLSSFFTSVVKLCSLFRNGNV